MLEFLRVRLEFLDLKLGTNGTLLLLLRDLEVLLPSVELDWPPVSVVFPAWLGRLRGLLLELRTLRISGFWAENSLGNGFGVDAR